MFVFSLDFCIKDNSSILSQAMSLLTPTKLNIPINGGGADEDEQTDVLIRPVSEFVRSFKQRPLSYLTSFLLPRRMNILSLYTSGKSNRFYF